MLSTSIWSEVDSTQRSFLNSTENTVRKILKWFHAVYGDWSSFTGPIVRTYPNELHIYDKEAYDQVFRVGTPFDKYRPFYDHPLGEGSHFNMAGLKDAKSRRDIFAPYLSKSAVRKMEPLVKQTLMRFIAILLEAGEKCKVVNLTRGYHSLTTDAIMNYGWQRPFGAIEYADFQFPSVKYMNEYLIGAVLVRTFHPLFRILLDLAFRWPVLTRLSETLSNAVWLRLVSLRTPISRRITLILTSEMSSSSTRCFEKIRLQPYHVFKLWSRKFEIKSSWFWLAIRGGPSCWDYRVFGWRRRVYSKYFDSWNFPHSQESRDIQPSTTRTPWDYTGHNRTARFRGTWEITLLSEFKILMSMYDPGRIRYF